MQNKSSKWLEGIIFAENIGLDEVVSLYLMNEFSDSDPEFLNGILDYISFLQGRNCYAGI